MSLSTLPISYCTNAHPGLTVDEVIAGLRQFTIPARQALQTRIGAGLWLAAGVVEELLRSPKQLARLKQVLAEGDLTCYTLNAFPYGNFHSERVKENVYLPDWTDSLRAQYTVDCGRLLAELMPAGVEGSISTVPLGFKPLATSPDFKSKCIEQLLTVAREFDRLHDDSGQVVRLAIEPEPCCVLETTAEALEFFRQLFDVAESRGELEIARRHLGVCYDVCHQAVEFEDIPASIAEFNAAGIRINKVHLTCAVHVDHPGENTAAREQLRSFVEPRYLHQTFAQRVNAPGETASSIVHQIDLTDEMCRAPSEEFAGASAWRVHFHVPVHRESLGALSTTRSELKRAIGAVDLLDYAPHLEVETYTWNVLPGEEQGSLVDGLVSELAATAELLSQCRKAGAAPENSAENRASE